MAIYSWTKYNLPTSGLTTNQVAYGKYWSGGASPGSADLDPVSVLAGACDGIFDTVLAACNTAGGYFWYRQTYNGPGITLPGGVPKNTVNGRTYLNISNPAGIAYAVSVEEYVRDYLLGHTYADRFLVVDSGAGGWLNEMNFPSTDWSSLVSAGWTKQDLADYHNAMVGVWGANRMCSNMGGSSIWWGDYRAAISASGIQCVRQDAFGPGAIANMEDRGKMYNQFITDIGYIPLCINLEVSGSGSCNQPGHWSDYGATTNQIQTCMGDHTHWTGMTGGQPNSGTFPALLFSDMGCNPSTGYGATWTNYWNANWSVYQNTLSNAWYDIVFASPPPGTVWASAIASGTGSLTAVASGTGSLTAVASGTGSASATATIAGVVPISAAVSGTGSLIAIASVYAYVYPGISVDDTIIHGTAYKEQPVQKRY